jgi:ABC-type uncharacterized transport system permease subunit
MKALANLLTIHTFVQNTPRFARIGRYLLVNSYRESNQSRTVIILSLAQPLIQSLGFILLFSYITRPTFGTSSSLTIPILSYFMFTIALLSIDLGKFLQHIQRSIANERYLAIDRLPITPFWYYFFSSIGKNALTLVVLLGVGLLFFTIMQLPIIYIVAYIPVVLLGLLLAHLLYFALALTSFYADELNLWGATILFAFLSGQLLPIHLLPSQAATVFQILPFAYAAGALAKNYSNLDLGQFVTSIILSTIWIIVFYQLTAKIWNHGSSHFHERN